MKYAYLFILLSTFCLKSTSQVFENVYSSMPGEVLLIREFSKTDVAILFRDNRSNTFNISILDEEGQMKRTNRIPKIDSLRAFDAIYKRANEYVITYSIASSSGSNNEKYFAQGFDYFNQDLVFKSRNRQVFNDTAVLANNTAYEIGDNLLWSGYRHKSKTKTLETVIKQFELGEVKERPSVTTIDTIEQGDSHKNFIRTFYVYDTTIAPIFPLTKIHEMWIVSNGLLLRRQFGVWNYGGTYYSGSPQPKDTFDQLKIYENGEIFTAYFKDILDIERIQGGYILTLYAYMNNVSRLVLVKLLDDKTISYRIIPSNYLDLSGIMINYGFITTPKGKIAISQYYVYSFTAFDSSSIFSKASIFRYDFDLNIMGEYKIFDRNSVGNISMIKPSKDGGCYVVGNRKVDSSGTDFMFIAKLDPNNIVSYVSAISPARQNIYPNPGMDFISGIPEQCILKLTDISGRIITLEPEASHINVSTLNTGIYFYQIINSEGNIVSSGKWIKQ